MEQRIIQITSGKGPDECCRVVARVQQYFMKAAREAGFEIQVISDEAGDLKGTLRSTLLHLHGKQISEFLGDWQGTIQWIAQSPYRKLHRRKNWFVGLEVFEVPEKVIFRPEDVVFETLRGGGPGGQHVNKVETAVRGKHLPSGISVLASDSRSQLQNRKQCLERLRRKVESMSSLELVGTRESQWLEHHQLERGNPVRVFRERL